MYKLHLKFNQKKNTSLKELQKTEKQKKIHIQEKDISNLIEGAVKHKEALKKIECRSRWKIKEILEKIKS